MTPSAQPKSVFPSGLAPYEWGLRMNLTAPLTHLKKNQSSHFTTRAPPYWRQSLTWTIIHRLIAMRSEASVSHFSIVSYLTPPPPPVVLQGALLFPRTSCYTHANRFCIFLWMFSCVRTGSRRKGFTSGWRIGTQPASFSYSSIASTILVVMLAEHCGKREAALVETNRGGGGDSMKKKHRWRMGQITLRVA